MAAASLALSADSLPTPRLSRPTLDDEVVDYDENLLPHIERVLREFLAEAQARISPAEPEVAPLIAALTEFVFRGGKRLRPAFAWWAWRGCGGHPEHAGVDGVLQALGSLELIQACALVHDDLMDASDTRRGKPCVHVAFAKQHAGNGWLGRASAFGQAAAILVGDMALAWADDMFANAPLTPAMRLAAQPVWRTMRTDVLAGQYLDVYHQAVGSDSAAAAVRVSARKTAGYTVAHPLRLGAALAGAEDQLSAALHRVGTDIGLGFQLRDDLLGVFGDPVITGKPAGDDLREGKRTLLIALGLRHARQQGRAADERTISAAVGNRSLSIAEVDKAREALMRVGAVTAVERKISTLTNSALAALRDLQLAEPAKTKLIELSIKATQRAA